MAVVSSNLIQGPGTLYTGVFGAVEPLDSAVNAAPAATTWRDVGGTQDGVTLAIGQEFSELSVDQVIDRVESRRTGRSVTIGTNLAEATLENLQFVLNGGTVATGTGYKTYDPDMAGSATQPVYFALIFDGWAPMVSNAARTRRVIARKCLNIEGVETAYKKEDQTLFPVSFQLHFVSDSIKPFHITDQV